jgi:beta-lactamase class A
VSTNRSPANEDGRLSHEALIDVIAKLDARCHGRLGVAARRLGTDEEVLWHDQERFRTASTVKVAIHAALLADVNAGRLDLGRRVPVTLSDLTGGSGVLSVLRPGIEPTVADLCTAALAPRYSGGGGKAPVPCLSERGGHNERPAYWVWSRRRAGRPGRRLVSASRPAN